MGCSGSSGKFRSDGSGSGSRIVIPAPLQSLLEASDTVPSCEVPCTITMRPRAAHRHSRSADVGQLGWGGGGGGMERVGSQKFRPISSPNLDEWKFEGRGKVQKRMVWGLKLSSLRFPRL